MNQIQTMIDALVANNNMCIDDHHHRGDLRKVEAIAMLGKHVILILKGEKCYSINPLYIKDGKVHLSADSCGGMIDQRNYSLEEAITEYNIPGNAAFARPPITDLTFIADPIDTIPAPARIVTIAIPAELVQRSIDLGKECNRTHHETVGLVLMEAMAQADCIVHPQEAAKHKLSDSEGYYGPLRHSVLVDDKDVPLVANTSVTVNDPANNARVYVIVLAPGDNLVIHFRSPEKKEASPVVATAHTRIRSIIGLQPCWVNDAYGLINAARTFGFEYDTRMGAVAIPRTKVDNYFKLTKYIHSK